MNRFLLLQKHLHNSLFLETFRLHYYSNFLQGQKVLQVITTVADVDVADVVTDEVVAAGASDVTVRKKLYQMMYNYMLLVAT